MLRNVCRNSREMIVSPPTHAKRIERNVILAIAGFRARRAKSHLKLFVMLRELFLFLVCFRVSTENQD